MLRFFFAIALATLAHGATCESASAQVDPRGMYFMRNTQGGTPTSFSEWFSVTPIAGTNRYALRDFFGYGWNGTIQPGGQITIDGGYPGSFSGPDNFSTQVGGGPGYLYNCNRTVGTTVDFPSLLPNPAVAGNPDRAGDYDGLTEFVNPETEGVTSSTPGNVTLTVTGTELRLSIGSVFYEGLFVADDRVAIRVIQNTVTGWVPQYASYPGTTTNSNLDVVGELVFDTDNSFTAILCRQTRSSIGTQSQSLLRVTGNRVPTGQQRPGDFNQDGELAISDATGLLSALFVAGTVDLPCEGSISQDGNLAVLDVTGDDLVDIADALSMLNYLFLGGPAPTSGVDCIPVELCEDACP